MRRRAIIALATAALALAGVLLLTRGESGDGQTERLENAIADARCPGDPPSKVRCKPLRDDRYACVKSRPDAPDERLTVDDHPEFSIIC